MLMKRRDMRMKGTWKDNERKSKENERNMKANESKGLGFDTL